VAVLYWAATFLCTPDLKQTGAGWKPVNVYGILQTASPVAWLGKGEVISSGEYQGAAAHDEEPA
jgi:hypothetical protein